MKHIQTYDIANRKDMEYLRKEWEKGNVEFVEDKVDGLAVDTFSTELGCTVRSCLSCGVLIAGGATRCGFCAYRYSARAYGWWDPLWKFMKRLSKAVKFFSR